MLNAQPRVRWVVGLLLPLGGSAQACPGGNFSVRLTPAAELWPAGAWLRVGGVTFGASEAPGAAPRASGPVCLDAADSCVAVHLAAPDNRTAASSLQWAVHAVDATAAEAAEALLSGAGDDGIAFGTYGAIGAGCDGACDCNPLGLDATATEGPLAGGCSTRLGFASRRWCYVVRPQHCVSAFPSDAYPGQALRECELSPPPAPAAPPNALAGFGGSSSTPWLSLGWWDVGPERAVLLLVAFVMTVAFAVLLAAGVYFEKRSVTLCCNRVESEMRPTLRWTDPWLLALGLAQFSGSAIFLACLPWGHPFAPFGWSAPTDPNSTSVGLFVAAVFLPMAGALGYVVHSLAHGTLLNARTAMSSGVGFGMLVCTAVLANADALRLAPWREVGRSSAFRAGSVIECSRLLPLLVLQLIYAYLSIATRGGRDFLSTAESTDFLASVYFAPPPDVPPYLPLACALITLLSAGVAAARAALRCSRRRIDPWAEPCAEWEARARAARAWRGAAERERVAPTFGANGRGAAGSPSCRGRLAVSKRVSTQGAAGGLGERFHNSVPTSPSTRATSVPSLFLPGRSPARPSDGRTPDASGSSSPGSELHVEVESTGAEAAGAAAAGGADGTGCVEMSLSSASASVNASWSPAPPTPHEPLWAAALRVLPGSDAVYALAIQLRDAEAECKEAKIKLDPAYKGLKRRYYDVRRMLIQQLLQTHEVLSAGRDSVLSSRTAEAVAAVLWRAENPTPAHGHRNLAHLNEDSLSARMSNDTSADHASPKSRGLSPQSTARSCTSHQSAVSEAHGAGRSSNWSPRDSPHESPLPTPMRRGLPSQSPQRKPSSLISTPGKSPAACSPRQPAFGLRSRSSWTPLGEGDSVDPAAGEAVANEDGSVSIAQL